MGTSYTGTSGGYFYVVAKNGNTPKGVSINWKDEIDDIVEAHDWGTTDLFPQFGMASLPGPAVESLVKKFVESAVMKQNLKQVEHSMGRSRLTLRGR